MKNYKITYIGIGGYERYATIEAYTAFDARKEFENSYWSYHEILSVEELR